MSDDKYLGMGRPISRRDFLNGVALTWTTEDKTDPRVGMSEARNRLLHTIGNLTILTQELNSSVSNSAWGIKSPALLQASLLPINLQLHGVKTWDEITIEQRSDDLFARAIQIWPRAI